MCHYWEGDYCCAMDVFERTFWLVSAEKMSLSLRVSQDSEPACTITKAITDSTPKWNAFILTPELPALTCQKPAVKQIYSHLFTVLQFDTEQQLGEQKFERDKPLLDVWYRKSKVMFSLTISVYKLPENTSRSSWPITVPLVSRFIFTAIGGYAVDVFSAFGSHLHMLSLLCKHT